MKHLCKYFFLSVMITGCASNQDSVSALKNWDDKYYECFIVNKYPQSFPENIWFNNLETEDKKIVIGYLYNYNSRACIENEVNALKEALEREGNKSLIHIFEMDLSPLESASFEAIKHLDQNELQKLQKEYSTPFNLSEVIKTLGLYN
ncbi:hypothetical protein [Vibrio metschnikovii]|uniref:hypothetical protein n=1 Tax=Vibrio metschnikovii TaxID=28172 RepID=UPI002FC8C765